MTTLFINILIKFHQSERRTDSVRHAHSLGCRTMLHATVAKDDHDSLSPFHDSVLCTKVLDNLPKYGTEEMNLTAVVERQVHTDPNILGLTTTINQHVDVQTKCS